MQNDFQNHLITSMAELIESRDLNTGRHVKRTSEYVRIIAENAKKAGYHKELLTDGYVEALVQCAPLHDVGKILVSDTVLNKPDKLSEREKESMRNHTINGRKVVKSILGDFADPKYYHLACDIATYHHEHWDGSGYPEGLVGEEIPVSARIMAIADVYDALVARRAYKDSMTSSDAFEIIESEAGSHFDPELVRIFVKSESEITGVMEHVS